MFENIAPATLVIGADGLIGRALTTHLRAVGKHVIGTTRRSTSVDDSHLYLDLAEDLDSWHPPRISVAVLCAGVSRIESCRVDPEATEHINVDAICALARKLVERGSFVIYLSTNQVFDGTLPNRLPDEPASPLTVYGKQRAKAEKRLLALGDLVSIVRLSKVLPPEPPLFKDWIAKLRKGDLVRPFADMVMAPVPLSFVVKTIETVADRRLPGILQVSGERDVSYAEVARLIAKQIGASDELIQVMSSREAGIPVEEAPEHTTLDSQRLRNELGLEPPDVWSTINSAVGV